jgi:pSer/pThr/pTyr-binding forkhead associated (FHA) protein
VAQPGSGLRAPAGTIFNLKPATTLGAGQDNDIVLGDRFISSHHLRLRWDGAVWWLEDLNSRNGTFVNRQPCPPGRPQTLLKGAEIRAGDMVMELID